LGGSKVALEKNWETMWKTDDSYFTGNKWNNNLRLDLKNENNNMDKEFTMLYHRNCSRRNMENCGVSSTNQNWIVPTNTPAKVEDHGENFELHQ
jgi:hypothetical protein